MKVILPRWFDDLVEKFSYKEVQFIQFDAPVNLPSCHPAENINETPGYIKSHGVFVTPGIHFKVWANIL